MPAEGSQTETNPPRRGKDTMAKLSARGRTVAREWRMHNTTYRLVSDGVLLRKFHLSFPTDWKVVNVSSRFPTQEKLIEHMDFITG